METTGRSAKEAKYATTHRTSTQQPGNYKKRLEDLEIDEYIRHITAQAPLCPRIFTEEYHFRGITKRVDLYIARIQDPYLVQIQRDEIRAFQWFPINQVAAQLTFDEDRDLFNSVVNEF